MTTRDKEFSSTSDRVLAPLQALSARLRETFDPGGNLPEDCAEWADAHEAALNDLDTVVARLRSQPIENKEDLDARGPGERLSEATGSTAKTSTGDK